MRSLAMAASACLLMLSAVAPAWAVPGTPGVPQAPRVVFAEDFENGVGARPILLTGYTGASGQTYSAAPQWLTACNGAIVQGASPNADQAASGCASATSYGAVRQLAYALGAHHGSITPATNHAVTAYTESPSPGADRIQFETTSPIALPTSGRFITFSVDAAEANCHANHVLFKFYLLDGSTEIPTFRAPIDPCTASGGTSIRVPAIGSAGAGSARTGTYASDSAVLFSGSQLGIRMRNGQGSATGNDAAFDNVQALDVTPQLDKSLSPASLGVGQTATLTFTITNTSELGAKSGWSFTDTLPAGVVVTDPAPSTTCSATNVTAPVGGGSIAVAGNLTAGQASCTVTVSVSSAGAGAYMNCPANVTTVGLDAPGCASVVFNAADLAIVKRASSSSVVPGTEESFELVVTNNGPSVASNVVVTDALPAEFSYVSASPGCAELNATVTCAIGALDPGASTTLRVTGRVASSLDHCLANTARVASDTPDPSMDDNDSTICVPVEGRAELSIAKTASRTELPAGGGQVMYTLVVENDGPSDATGVTVTDPLARGLRLVSAVASQGSCTSADGRPRCSLGTLVAGGSAQVLVTAEVAGAPGSITNTATVTADQRDADVADNSASARVRVPPGPSPPARPRPPARPFDLVVSKTASARQVSVGQPVTYRIVVTNRGPAAAPDVTMTDTLNAPVSVRSVKSTAGSCSRRIPMRCSLGTIPAGGEVTITVVARHRRARCSDRNTASATGAGTDATPAGNLDTARVCARRIRLRLTKVADRRTAVAGALITYTIRVANPSATSAPDVRTCDRLPAGLVYVSASSKPRLRGGAWCWYAKTLAPGKSKRYRITVRALPGTGGPKVNRATTAGSGRVRAAFAKRAVHVIRRSATGGGVTG